MMKEMIEKTMKTMVEGRNGEEMGKKGGRNGERKGERNGDEKLIIVFSTNQISWIPRG